MSDLPGVLTALGLDPLAGVELLPVSLLHRRPPAGDLPAVITGITAAAHLEQVQAALRGCCPDGLTLTAVLSGGATVQLPLERLCELADRLDPAAAALYVPPVAAPSPRRHPLDPLVNVMARLRGPDGCPWDREQTHLSLRPYMVEEAYEAVEAMTAGAMEQLQEELGDVLLQVVFHAQLARERGDFTVDQVVQVITEKLIRRHPHVFGDVKVAGAADVVRNWQAIKAAEKGDRGDAPPSLLAGAGKGMPALVRAYEVQKKAAKVGFDWPDVQGALAKVAEELAELQSAPPGPRQEEELGDLLFAVVNVARFYKVNPEIALLNTTNKFMSRFAYMEAASVRLGRKLEDLTLFELDQLWEEAKRHTHP